jgi:hypothetical protein
MKKYLLVILLFFFIKNAAGAQNTPGAEDRKLWLSYLDKLARPVLSNLAADKLKEKMPVVLSVRIDNKESRSKSAYLEAFGRVLVGIAPWLNLEGGSKEEIALRDQYRQWTLKAIAHTVDTTAHDYLQWKGGQQLVDASFVAFGLVRCPWLWEHLDDKVKAQVIEAFKITRATVPGYNNWILFSAMIEVFFAKYNYEFDPLRVEYGIRQFMQQWYVGDGVFSDGEEYHWDYYNSYVIQPYLATIFSVMAGKTKAYESLSIKFDKISKRYAEIQERMINTDGSFPVTGRSITYRGAAFHHLADISLRKQLPASLKPAQVRAALTAVLKKTMEVPGVFTKDGWLNIGLYGNQPDLADVYINTGSEYLCTTIFLPLGLSDKDEFWSAPSLPWSAVKVWKGVEDLPADHALDLSK